MKSLKLIVATIVALASAHLASAQTYIRITGSTAYRSAVEQAIQDILNPGFTYGFTGAGPVSGATESIFVGTTKSGSHSVIIKTAWSGSVGGVFTLTQGDGVPNPLATPAITAGFLPDTDIPSLTTTGTPNLATNNFETPVKPVTSLDQVGFPNIALSDSFQASTPYGTPVLHDTEVGVVPFEWVRNNGSFASITNITNQLARALLINGSLPLNQFDNSGDFTDLVYVTGRNSDSGTRLDAFDESFFGSTQNPVQVDPTGDQNTATTVFDTIVSGAWVSGSAGVAYFITLSPADGYSSGGTLAAAMEATGGQAVLGGSLVTYLGLADTATAVGGGAVALPYNGIPYSAAAVENGSYSFWSYEHFLQSPLLTAAASTDLHKVVAGLLSTQIAAETTTAGIQLSLMNVARKSEGAPIF